MPVSKHSISGLTPSSRISTAPRAMKRGVFVNTKSSSAPKFMLPASSEATSGPARSDASRSSSDIPGLPPVVKFRITSGASARMPSRISE